MYTDFFELKEKPFSITPDPSFFFLSETHLEALNHLLYGVNNGEGFIMITGDVGSGKTTLTRCLLRKIDSDVKIALILNPMLTEKELIASILQDLGVTFNPSTKKELIDKLNLFLLEQLEKEKKPAIIIIDEAQDLTIRLMEQVRLLSNMETNKNKLLQIILVGQNELNEKLSLPILRQLNQRITVRYELKYLNRQETVSYIHHRLLVAGSNGRIHFTPEAIDLIYRYSKGIPRLINIIADRAMLCAYMQSTNKITKKLVKKGIKSIEVKKARPYDISWLTVVLLCIFLLCLAYFFYIL